MHRDGRRYDDTTAIAMLAEGQHQLLEDLERRAHGLSLAATALAGAGGAVGVLGIAVGIRYGVENPSLGITAGSLVAADALFVIKASTVARRNRRLELAARSHRVAARGFADRVRQREV